eukprot:gene7491-22732_t
MESKWKQLWPARADGKGGARRCACGAVGHPVKQCEAWFDIPKEHAWSVAAVQLLNRTDARDRNDAPVRAVAVKRAPLGTCRQIRIETEYCVRIEREHPHPSSSYYVILTETRAVNAYCPNHPACSDVCWDGGRCK